MAYGRDPYAHLGGVGTLASATPGAIANARRRQAQARLRGRNHDQMKVRLATGRVALGYTAPHDLDGDGGAIGGGGGRGTGGGGATGTGPARTIGGQTLATGGAGLLQRFVATQTVPGGLVIPRTAGGIPVPTQTVPIYPSPGTTTPTDPTTGTTGGAGAQIDDGHSLPDGYTSPDSGGGSSIMDSFNGLSTTGKLAVAGGALAALYFIFGRRGAR